MEVIRFENGSVTMRTEKGKQLVYNLIRSGTFWEHVSVLLEKDANPVTDDVMNQLLNKLNELNAITFSGGVGAAATNSPTNSEGPVAQVTAKKQVNVSPTKIDLKSTSKSKLLNKMKKMEGSGQ